MSGFSATVALTVATVVIVGGGSQRAQFCGDTSTYSLNGQNVEWPRTNTGRYVAKNIMATRVQVWSDRAFVLIPRFRTGVPFTVSTVRLDCQDRCWPILSPYPFWSLHDESDSTAIQNPVDMYLDPMGIIWVLDIGQVNTTVQQPVHRIQPKIIAINVQTNKIVNRIDLSGLACPTSRLNYITVDYGNDGQAFVYVSDAATRAVIVWEVQADRGYRVVLPNAITSDCTSNRDVLYIALAQRSSGGNVLYLTYLTSSRLYSIDTCNLRKGCSRGTVTDLGLKPVDMVILGTDSRTTVYFRYRGLCDIYAWDTDPPEDSGGSFFNSDRFALVRKVDDCGRLATHVTPGSHDGVLWILESNFPDYISGTVGGLGANVRLQPLNTQCNEKQ